MGKKGGGNLGRQLARTQGFFFFDYSLIATVCQRSLGHIYIATRDIKTGNTFGTQRERLFKIFIL